MPPAVDPGRARRAGFLAVGAPGEYCEQTEQEQHFPRCGLRRRRKDKDAMAHTDRPATLRDVATAAGVHPATASRALNPGTRLLVSEETARRVSEAGARLGSRPTPVARSLRTRRSHTIGVLI